MCCLSDNHRNSTGSSLISAAFFRPPCSDYSRQQKQSLFSFVNKKRMCARSAIKACYIFQNRNKAVLKILCFLFLFVISD